MNRVMAAATSALIVICFAATAMARQAPNLAAAITSPSPDVKISGVAIEGAIEGENITFALTFTAKCLKDYQHVVLMAGDVALEEVTSPKSGYRVQYNATRKSYAMRWRRAGTYKVSLSFAARPKKVDKGPWREASFTLPVSRLRRLAVRCDRTDLEVRFPGALRLERKVEDASLTITAMLGPGAPFAVRWKPQVAELDARLVASGEINTIAIVGAGALRVDSVFVFNISQGKLREVSLRVPKELSLTQVRGRNIRDWRIEGEGEERRLKVTLNRAQTKQYALQIMSEMMLSGFPTEAAIPVILPEDDIRAGGHLSIGTDSAIQLVVKQTGGLAQVEGSSFPRLLLDRQSPRRLPRSKAFYYTYASAPYQLKIALDDIVPSYDVAGRMVVKVREDDLTVDLDLDLDIRDAPLRDLTVNLPAGFIIASVTGREVEDHSIRETKPDAESQQVDIHFRKPVIGRTLAHMRMELGKSPLDAPLDLQGIAVEGAKSERGYIVLVADRGVEVETPKAKDLREVHTGSVPMRVANAQFAYRFRDRGWALGIQATGKPAGVLAESFHLISLGEGVLYGYVAVNYFISGAPVDELRFRAPAELGAIEFIGADVRRWFKKDDVWTVKLRRKVIGEYNLGVSWNKRYNAGETIRVGGLECEGVESRTGFICAASHLNLKLAAKEVGPTLLEIKRDEIPDNYRLLVNAPILKVYKYVDQPHAVTLKVDAYARGSLVPAIVEVMELRTKVNVRDEGETESVTRIRYKVKNSSSQFLSLSMPPGATVWATRVVRGNANGREQSTRVAASFDHKTGLLMVPLQRRRDPNDPITVEIEYGVSHDDAEGADALQLTAPKSAVQATFADWQVSVPEDWAVRSGAGGNMVPKERELSRGDLGAVMGSIVRAWKTTCSRWSRVDSGIYIAASIVSLIVLLLTLIFRRRALPTAFAILALLAVCGAGIIATRSPAFRQLATDEYLTSISFTQAVNLDNDAPMSVGVDICPAWRRHATFTGAIVIPALALACLILACACKKRRAPLLALAIVGALYATAQFPAAAVLLAHLFTWGVPGLLALWLIARAIPRRRRATVVAMALALAMFALTSTGCATSTTRGFMPPKPTVDSAEYLLTAEKDSLAVTVSLKVATPRPTTIPLLDASALLLSPEELSKDAAIVRSGGRHCLSLKRRGTYALRLKFLSPLAEAGEDQVRQFTMPSPRALTNRAELTIPATGLEVVAPTAIRFTREEKKDSTVARAVLAPGEVIAFAWRPRARKRKLEETSFFAELISVFRFDTGLAKGHTRIRFQIAQGELRDIRIHVPEEMTVTGVVGDGLGTWRFDPAKHELEARLTQPVSGAYVLNVTTLMSSDAMPYTASIRPLKVVGAVRQRGILGLTVSPAVYVTPTNGQQMNVNDFSREAAPILAPVSVSVPISTPTVSAAAPTPTDPKRKSRALAVRQVYRTQQFDLFSRKNAAAAAAAALKKALAAGPAEVKRATERAMATAGVRHAYRVLQLDEALTVKVEEVRPEIRAIENTGFTVSDERLVCTGTLDIAVAKAGVFSVELSLPDGYDIDTLAAPEVSHWDENTADGKRTIRVHFHQKLLGSSSLKLALSRPAPDLRGEITVPRVSVLSALKHSGQMLITSDRGVRLSVGQRQGVSELNALELGVRSPGALAFRLLRPDWTLALKAEVVEPRINVEFCHVAKVSDGVVRNTQYLRYRLYNAGSKVFEVQVPKDAVGLVINGPEIAHLKEVSAAPRIWRVELAQKRFDRPYPLTIRYETQFDRTTGDVPLRPVKALGVDLQRGHVVIYATERVELAPPPLSIDAPLHPADARSLPTKFGAGDLSGAAFCFKSPSADYVIAMKATRHAAAPLLEAKVLETTLKTVVNERGETINHARLQLRVGGRRHLEARLPQDARVWSLFVNLRSETPSTRLASDGAEVTLVPLAQAVSGELPVNVDLIYVTPPAPAWDAKRQQLLGPRFDLPLNNITWHLYLPEGLNYDDFEGTLAVDDDTLKDKRFCEYNISAYESARFVFNVLNREQAIKFQKQGAELARKGKQYEARQAFESAFQYSYNDAGLNEDARIQLHNLLGQQAIVGLVNQRGQLRQQKGEVQAQPAPVVGANFKLEQAERLQNSLNQSDSKNLSRITRRLIDIQEAAAGSRMQLMISVPLRGRMIDLSRPLQVKPNAAMEVSFTAEHETPPRVKTSWWWAGGIFLVLLFLFTAGQRCSGRPPESLGDPEYPEGPKGPKGPKNPERPEDQGSSEDEPAAIVRPQIDATRDAYKKPEETAENDTPDVG